MNRNEFIDMCELIKENRENLIAASKLDIDLVKFSEKYLQIIDIFGKSHYGEILWESILDFIHGDWDGRIYSVGGHKLIRKIDNFVELWEYLESVKLSDGKFYKL